MSVQGAWYSGWLPRRREREGRARVAALTGASWQTVATGKAELDAGDEPPPGRAARARRRAERAAERSTDAPAWPRRLEKLMRDARCARRRSGIAAGAGRPAAREHLSGRAVPPPGTARLDCHGLADAEADGLRPAVELPGPGRTAAPGAGRAVPAYRRAGRGSTWCPGAGWSSVDSERGKDRLRQRQAASRAPDRRSVAPVRPTTAGRKQAHAIPYGIYDEQGNAGSSTPAATERRRARGEVESPAGRLAMAKTPTPVPRPAAT